MEEQKIGIIFNFFLFSSKITYQIFNGLCPKLYKLSVRSQIRKTWLVEYQTNKNIWIDVQLKDFAERNKHVPYCIWTNKYLCKYLLLAGFKRMLFEFLKNA